MLKIISISLLIFLQPIITKAIELECQFEEVYLDGEIQNGLFLIKNDNMRYEYFDRNLYIIFKKKNDFYLVNKKDTEKFQKIPKDKNYVLDFISLIANDYPNIKDFYENEHITLRVEKNSKNFFKRISILSDNLSLSIYLNNCENKKIENRFFYYFPYFEYR